MTFSLAWWRVRHDPAWLLLHAADAVPVRTRVAVGASLARIACGVLRRRSSSAAAAVTAAFALVHTGDAAGLHALIARRMHRAGQRERVALARLLTEAGDPATALDLLRDAPAIPPVRPVRGRVLHVLNNSLPHVVAGYTVRSHRVAQAQRNAGLRPVMHRPAVLHPTSPFDNARAALALRAAPASRSSARCGASWRRRGGRASGTAQNGRTGTAAPVRSRAGACARPTVW